MVTGKLFNRSDSMGRTWNKRPACLLPTHPPGHPPHPLRLYSTRPDPEQGQRRQTPRHPVGEFPRPNRGADDGKDFGPGER